MRQTRFLDFRSLLLGPALLAAGVARADGPGLAYNPLPDSAASGPATCMSAPANGIELDFSDGCAPGIPCPVAVTPDATAGQTTLSCTAVRTSGTGVVGVDQNPAQFTFLPGGATQTLFATCAPGSVATTGRLCCTEIRGFDKSFPVLDIACPPVATPVFASDPPSGTTLVLTGTIGATVQRVIAVSNDGSATLQVDPQDVPPPFGIAPAGASIGVGDPPASFTVSCVPAADVARTELRLDTNDPARMSTANAVVFPVECVADAAPPVPRARFSAALPQAIQATTTTPGSTTLTVANTGDANLVLGAASVGFPFGVSPPGATLVPGASATFTVTCGGASAGPYNAFVSFDTNDPDRDPALVDVNCAVAQAAAAAFASLPPPRGPIVIVTPQPATGTASLVVQSVGTTALTVNSAAFLAGSSTRLSVDPVSSSPIIPGDSRTFTISCAGSVVGNFTGVLRVATTAGSADYDISCGVNAVVAPRFGSVPLPGGTIAIATNEATPQTASLTLQNTGNAPLLIQSITGPVGPQVTRPALALPVTIDPGTATTITLTCLAMVSGMYSDLVTVGTNDATTPSASYPVACNVSGPPPLPQFASMPPEPGPVVLATRQGVPVSTTITVSNPGTDTLQILPIVGLDEPFTISPASASIAPGASAPFTVRCSATQDGSFNDVAVFPTNAPARPTAPFNLVCNVEFEPVTVMFSPPLSYSVQNNPRGLVTGRFDTDELLDVAVVNRNSGTVSVLYGTGTGGFRPRFDLAVGSSPFAIAAGQLNGDGRPDFVVANNGSNALSVLVSQGSAGYINTGNLPMGGPVDIALGRLNPDTFDDVATVSANFVAIRMGQGGGSFGSRIDLPLPSQSQGIQIADVNADGFNDLVISLTSDGSVGIMRGDGTGAFLPLATFPAGPGPTDVRTGDFNRDGSLDLAVANASANAVSVLPGVMAPLPGFGPPLTLAVDNFPFALEVADFNRDGRSDIAATGGSTISILSGRGDGRFAPAQTFTVDGGAEGVGAGDFDADGAPDLVVSSSGVSAVSVLINGPGRFLPSFGQASSNNPAGIVAADFDGDGFTDVAAANSGANAVDLFRGNGNGTLQAHTRHPAGTSPINLAAADFTGDGNLDIVTVSSTSMPTLLIGTGGGAFQAAVPVPSVGPALSVAAGDLSGDSVPDVAFAVVPGQVLLRRFNPATSAFESLAAVGSSSPKKVKVADMDRDGDLDVVAVACCQQLQLLRNEGSGLFTTSNTALSGLTGNASSLAIADFDRDGLPDAGVGSDNQSRFAIVLRVGAGLPPLVIISSNGVAFARDAAASDINGDGRPDLVITNMGPPGPAMGVATGSGDGQVQPPIPYAMGQQPLGVAVAAFNADQAPDVAVSDPNTGQVLIRLNATVNYGVILANGFE